MQNLKLFIVFYKETGKDDSVTVIDSFNCRSIASEFAAIVVDVPNPQVLCKSIFKSKYPNAYEEYYPKT